MLVGAISTLAGMAVMGNGSDDDNWKKIPDFVKERSVIIPVSNKDYIALPLPLGFNFIPNISRIAIEAAANGGRDLGKYMAELSLIIADAFNPLGESSNPDLLMSPTIMDPVVSLMQNRDWTGRKIYKEGESQLDPTPGFSRIYGTATPWSKMLAEALNKITGGTAYSQGRFSPTPDQIDFVIGQLTGGLGREISKSADIASAFINSDEIQAHKIPLIGRLYGNARGQAGQSEKFYDNIRKANEAENEIKGRITAKINPKTDLPNFKELATKTVLGNEAEKQVKELKKKRNEMIVRSYPREKIEVMRRFNSEMAGLDK